MEINDRSSEHGFIEVWLNREEQQVCDRAELTKQLLANAGRKKCKVVFLLSGSEELFPNTEGLLLANLRARRGNLFRNPITVSIKKSNQI